MVNNPILARFPGISNLVQPKRLTLQDAFRNPGKLPELVSNCPSAMRVLDLLGPLTWADFPERNLLRNWGQAAVPYTVFTAACLLKLNEHLVSMGDLRQYLVEHPAFIWLLGFPLVPSLRHSCGFDPNGSLPTERHLTKLLRKIPNQAMQFLFEHSVRLLLGYFAFQGIQAGECISLNTKDILAWVKENNHKDYVETRFDKTKQPKGDQDCKLGCKRRHNQRSSKGSETSTPYSNPVPATGLAVGEFYYLCKTTAYGSE